MKKVTLHRTVNKHIRYYKLFTYPSLFNEYLLIIKYGGIKNNKPTRTIKEYFTDMEDLMHKINSIIKKKQKKGYYCV